MHDFQIRASSSLERRRPSSQRQNINTTNDSSGHHAYSSDSSGDEKGGGANGSGLIGDPAADAAVVCGWVAASYGQEDEEYHVAYSREVIRQARGKAIPAWY